MVDVEAGLAQRIGDERAGRSWSLAELAERSGVSRSMLSKIERREASPTAPVLLRIAAAFDLTLAGLLTSEPSSNDRLLRRADQPVWRDPASGYDRRQVYLSPALPLELIEVDLPVGAAVAAPASSYALIRQVVWVLEGELVIQEGEDVTPLATGDRLEFGPPTDVVFRNPTKRPCRYVVALLRR